VKSLPSWNFTPWRSVKSIVVVFTQFQEVASAGTISKFSGLR
jgi:hypothetical protein